ncbi:Radical SAM domain protein [Olavius sp. associated proteobacterium Delta 1]|nr:Radical SAM domain protein [Olavius sp. associated proteobacterium Delta 1]
MIAFGPVPSRRLGRSLGINNIPPKVCTYSCVYCQVGKTRRMRFERCPFYEPEDIFASVRNQVKKAGKKGESIDYLTFVSDGEPTLDVNLGYEIDLLKSSGNKIGIITNASLIFREEVRADLMKADWVSLKLDSTWKTSWRKINRPHRELELGLILTGMLDFSKAFRGEFVTETMLVQGLNTDSGMLKELAEFLAGLNPAKAYLAIPTRPPAENWVRPPAPQDINIAFQVFHEKLDQVEYLIGYEGNAFAFTGNVEEDMLNITSVHPMRESAVSELLKKANADWPKVHQLIAQGKLVETEYEGQKFYLRGISSEDTIASSF